MVFCLLTYTVSPLFAENTRYGDMLFGQMAMGLGGAVTAVAGDSEAIFYNPASLSSVRGVQFEGSIQFYGFDRLSLREGFGRGDWFTPRDLHSDQFIARPTSTVMSYQSEDRRHSLSLSVFLVNDSEEFFEGRQDQERAGGASWSQPSKQSYGVAMNRRDREIQFGTSYAYSINQDLSIGLSAIISRRDQSWNLASAEWRLPSDEQNGRFSFTEYESSAKLMDLSGLLKLGLLYRATKRVNLGLACATSSQPIQGEGEVMWGTKEGDSEESATPNLRGGISDRFTVKSRQPWSCRAGVSWLARSWLRLTLDGAYHHSQRYDRLGQGESEIFPREALLTTFPLEVRRRAVTNLALGVQVKRRHFIWRGGAFTNHSAAEQIPSSPTRAYSPDVDLYGLTTSFARRGDALGLNLGLIYQWGDGEDVVFDQLEGINQGGAGENHRRIRREQQRLILFLSGLFNLL
ncbi:MAG: hypothetical protein VYD19_05810 [Myxococcota bacterium]|nr:hypothetical protein [Myxococcota bacterium]